MKRRHKIDSKHSRKLFTNTAKGAHRKNAMPTVAGPMRGGIRF